MSGRPRKGFADYNPDTLYFGKPCKENNHHQSNGMNPRKWQGMCLACDKKLPPGLLPYEYQGLAEGIGSAEPIGVVSMTMEERRVRHIEQQKAWNARNKEKVKVYHDKYRKKPERVLADKAKHKRVYEEIKADPVRYAARLQAQRDQYQRHREEILRKRHEKYHTKEADEGVEQA